LLAALMLMNGDGDVRDSKVRLDDMLIALARQIHSLGSLADIRGIFDIAGEYPPHEPSSINVIA
jgi:hypothetical protein